MQFIERLYLPSIRFALEHKVLTIGGAVAFWFLSLYTFNNMGGEFIPTLDEGDYVVQPILRPGTSLTENIRFCTRIEQILKDEFPEVDQVASRIGAAEVPTDPMSMEMSDIIIRLKPKDQWVSAKNKEELAEKMKEAMSVIPGVEYEFTQPIEMRFNELITGVRADLAIKIFGEDLDVLFNYGNRIKRLISNVEGAADISVEQIVGLPQMAVKYNRTKLAQYGLNVSDLNRYVRMAFAGEAAGMVFEGERRFDLVIRFDEEHRQDIDNLRQLYIELPAGGQVPLKEVADISISHGPAQISRDDTRRRIVVGINVRNRDVESLVAEIESIIEENIELPEGYYITYGGQFENLIEAKNRLRVAVPVALVLILLLLYLTFRSIVQALIVFTAIPMAAIGGVYLLWLRDMPFSISAGVGFIALFGIATLNGIVLISYFNELRARGVTNLRDRVCEGAKSRLRPVLLTAGAAALGFFPMALSSSAGAEVQRPLATVVIGGLTTATFLTLVVLPALYYMVYGSKLAQKFLQYGLKSVIIFILAISLTPGRSLAQEERLSLEGAQAIALEHNREVQNARMNVDASRALIKTGWDLGETEFIYTKGQINADPTDNLWLLKQNLGSPFHQPAKTGLLKKLVEKQESRLGIIERDVELQVAVAYFHLVWLNERRSFFQSNYQLYEKAERIANLQYETGESNYLSKVVMNTKREELRLKSEDAQAAIELAQQEFMKLLQTGTAYLPDLDTLMRYPLSFDYDSLEYLYEKSLDAQYLEKNVEVAAQSLKVEKSAISPSLSIGYFRQSIFEEPGFDGWEIGVKFPLWFRPKMGSVQSARINYEIESNAYRQQKFNHIQDLRILKRALDALMVRIHSYEKVSLENARLIIENADLLYANGEIEYLEYIRNISDAMEIMVAYLDAVNSYNQIVIKMNYLLRD